MTGHYCTFVACTSHLSLSDVRYCALCSASCCSYPGGRRDHQFWPISWTIRATFLIGWLSWKKHQKFWLGLEFCQGCPLWISWPDSPFSEIVAALQASQPQLLRLISQRALGRPDAHANTWWIFEADFWESHMRAWPFHWSQEGTGAFHLSCWPLVSSMATGNSKVIPPTFRLLPIFHQNCTDHRLSRKSSC